MELILVLLLFLSILLAMMLQLYFRDFTEFQSEVTFEEAAGKPGLLNSFFQWFYKKFKWAISDSDSFKLSMINDTKANFIKYKFYIGSIAAALLGVLFKSVFGAIIGFIIGWFLPSAIISSQYTAWTKSLAIELPILVRYVKMYITMGFNMKDSLDNTIKSLNDPLSSLLEDAMTRIHQTGDYKTHLMAVRNTVVGGEYEGKVDAVFKRIINGWTNPNLQAFDDTEKFLEELDQARIEQSTSSKRVKFILFLPLAMGTVFLMIGPVIITWVFNSMFTL